MEDVIHSVHGFRDALGIPHITDVKFQFIAIFRLLPLIQVTHVVLLQFIPGKNPNLSDIRCKETVQHGIAKRAGSSGNQ